MLTNITKMYSAYILLKQIDNEFKISNKVLKQYKTFKNKKIIN